MRHVEFTANVPPWQTGERRVVPDDVADRLIAAGHARGVPSAFDGPEAAPAYQARVVTPAGGAVAYATRKRTRKV